jgi:NTE family protein
VRGTAPDGNVVFRDISIPLKIIATDLTDQRIRLFGNGQRETPNERVAEAVAASITIPFFFVPHTFESPDKLAELVDGGLLSNFPAWVFDEERLRFGPLTPTLGFTLVERRPAQEANTGTLLGFASRLFTTALAGDSLLEIRQVANLQTIPLHVRVSTFDFDMTSLVKVDLYGDGWRDATAYFKKYAGPRDPKEMAEELKILHSHMQNKIGKGPIHLRVNVAMPTGKDRLKILYTYNMDDDADDRLEFSMDAGATGLCWQTRDFVVCDLVDAQKTFQSKYKMTKYQQALVRRDLRSLLSVPIFDYEQFSDTRSKTDNPLIGVLNFDSNEDLLADFASQPIQQVAVGCAKAMWNRLKA